MLFFKMMNCMDLSISCTTNIPFDLLVAKAGGQAVHQNIKDHVSAIANKMVGERAGGDSN